MVGNITVLFFLFMSFFISSAEVLFYATDMSLRLKKEYEKNKQFLVHVVVKKIAGQIDVDAPDLFGYGARRTSVQVSTVNGISTIKYSYVISFNQEGVYSLGKARVVSGNNEFFSPSLEVVVSDRVIEDDPKPAAFQNTHHTRQKENYLEPFSRLVINNNEAFVGQQISCFLSVYFDDAMHFAPEFRFALPLSHQYRINEIGKPEEGKEVFNGKSYRYIRWPFDLFPLKSGEISMEPFSIEYEYEDYHSNFQSIWDHLTHFFDKKRSTIKVSKQSLFVHEVPLFQGSPVQAVGQFKSFKALVSPLIISEKEVSTVTLELIGNGNLDDITHPSLAMIQNVSLYESNSVITALPGFKKKTFEYIVQPYQSGNLEIPSQTIITFDPIAKKHVLLKTDPQTIIVKGALNQEKFNSNVPLYSNQPKGNKAVLSRDQDLSAKPSDFVEQFKMPGKDFWDFSEILSSGYFFILLIVSLFLLTYYFFFSFSCYFIWLKKNSNRFFAYRRASTELLKLRLNRDAEGIYGVFIALFINRLQPSSIDFKYRFLQEKGAAFCNEVEQKRWHEFCSAIAALHFGVKEAKNNDALFNEASFWIDELQKKGL